MRNLVFFFLIYYLYYRYFLFYNFFIFKIKSSLNVAPQPSLSFSEALVKIDSAVPKGSLYKQKDKQKDRKKI